ncbi:Translation initiation factor 3 subunit b [Lobulomyces angularis]|nr:Translation initiation factor 3 subunit b [Lobulomyces angularis]
MPSKSKSPSRKQSKSPTRNVDEADEAIDFSDLEKKFNLEYDFQLSHVVCIDGLPVAPQSKLAKLQQVLEKKIYETSKIKINEDCVFMPLDGEGQTKGFAFITLENVQQATDFISAMNYFPFDKKHTLLVNHFEDIELFHKKEATYVEPVLEEFVEKEHLKSWLMDELGRDQWVMLHGENFGVYFNNKSDDPDLIIEKKRWSEYFVQWSPNGSYLATLHKQGVQLWGGETWKKIVKFQHPGVKLIDFSPNEKFLVTWSLEPYQFDLGERHNVAVWDIATGILLRTFPFDSTNLAKPSDETQLRSPLQSVKIHWPLFKWSHDDKYLAKANYGPTGSISVYETPGMGLLNKTSIKVPNIKAFEWSPSEPILSYWTPELAQIPARVTIMKIPSREIIRTKNLFNVIDCKLVWQNAGKFLLVQVDLQKAKKQTGINFELFRMTEKNVPIDVLELKTGDIVNAVSWEPAGDRFIVLLQDGQKIMANFYEMVDFNLNKNSSTVENVRLLKSVERKSVNKIFWAPTGRFAVLAAVGGSGELEFWDAEELVMHSSAEHFHVSDIEWDPTGRYVISSVSFWSNPTDNGYQIWTFQGTHLLKQPINQFKQLLWRPRPKTLLSPEQQKAIRKNLKEYSVQFDKIDTAISNRATKDEIERRVRLLTEWKGYIARCKKDYEKEAKERAELFGGVEGEEEIEEIDEIVEEVVEEIEEIVEEDDENERD